MEKMNKEKEKDQELTTLLTKLDILAKKIKKLDVVFKKKGSYTPPLTSVEGWRRNRVGELKRPSYSFYTKLKSMTE